MRPLNLQTDEDIKSGAVVKPGSVSGKDKAVFIVSEKKKKEK
jgi:hypothetical protein